MLSPSCPRMLDEKAARFKSRLMFQLRSFAPAAPWTTRETSASAVLCLEQRRPRHLTTCTCLYNTARCFLLARPPWRLFLIVLCHAALFYFSCNKRLRIMCCCFHAIATRSRAIVRREDARRQSTVYQVLLQERDTSSVVSEKPQVMLTTLVIVFCLKFRNIIAHQDGAILSLTGEDERWPPAEHAAFFAVSRRFLRQSCWHNSTADNGLFCASHFFKRLSSFRVKHRRPPSMRSRFLQVRQWIKCNVSANCAL